MPQAAAPPRPCVVLQKVRTLREVGLHQCLSERKGKGVPVRRLHVLSHVPSDPQTAAKVRDFSRAAPLCTGETDSPLEEDGFEPSVPPRERDGHGEGDPRPTIVVSRDPCLNDTIRLIGPAPPFGNSRDPVVRAGPVVRIQFPPARSQERTTERPKRRRNKQQLQFAWLSAVITVLILGCLVYEEIYCSRGDMENRIKECQLDLHFGDDAALCSTIGYRRRHRDYPMSTHDTWYPAGGLSRCGKPRFTKLTSPRRLRVMTNPPDRYPRNKS